MIDNSVAPLIGRMTDGNTPRLVLNDYFPHRAVSPLTHSHTFSTDSGWTNSQSVAVMKNNPFHYE